MLRMHNLSKVYRTHMIERTRCAALKSMSPKANSSP